MRGVDRIADAPRSHLRRYAIVIAVMTLFAAECSVARTRAGDTRLSTLAARIDAHVSEPRFASAAWGIKVVSLDTGATLVARNAEMLFTPASTAKLFTAALALDSFGPDHRIATSLFATARPARDGEMRGDLVLVGYGDPTLGFDKRVSWSDTLAIALRKTGVTMVRGDIVADATWFSGPTFGSGWEAGDLQSWFGVPATALSVNENIVRVRVEPGAIPGARARLGFEPSELAPAVENRLRTVEKGGVTDISLYRAPGTATLHVFGSIALGTGEQNYRVALDDPALAAASELRAALARQGVSVSGKLRSVYWPALDDTRTSDKLWRVADIGSPPLAEIVQRGLKVSQNLYMQNLLLLVGRQAELDALAAGNDVAIPFRSTEDRAIARLRTYLAGIGIASGSALIEDGAGLSRRNLTSATALTTLLVHQGTTPEASAFRLALPEAGVDGSLTVRMRNTPAQGRIRAKTGSMRYTHSLAGYAITAAGERLAFALMLNNYAVPAQTVAPRRASAELDAIAVMLATVGERSAPAVQPAP